MLGLKARATRAGFVLFLVKTVCSRNPSLQITRIPAGSSPKEELVQNTDLRGHCTRNLESLHHIPCKPSGEVTREKRARGWTLPSCVVEMSPEWISTKLAALTHLISPKYFPGLQLLSTVVVSPSGAPSTDCGANLAVQLCSQLCRIPVQNPMF